MFDSYVAAMPQTTDLEDGLCIAGQLGKAVEVSLLRYIESQGSQEQSQCIVHEFLTQLGAALNDGSWRRTCYGKSRLAQTVELLRRFLILCKAQGYNAELYLAWFMPGYLKEALRRVDLLGSLRRDIRSIWQV